MTLAKEKKGVFAKKKLKFFLVEKPRKTGGKPKRRKKSFKKPKTRAEKKIEGAPRARHGRMAERAPSSADRCEAFEGALVN